MSPRAKIAAAAEKARDFSRKPEIRRARAIFQYGLLACIVIYLVLRLSKVGWGEVADALPTSLFFYLIFIVRYFALPLSEIPTYELVWRRPLWRYFSAFVRKRVYNFAVMGYSGEAFFTLWARRTLDLSDKQILVGVKDNNLISALVSNVATALLVTALFFNGHLVDDLNALPGSTALFALAFLSAASLAVAVIVFRRKIIDLPRGVMSKLVAINAGRMALMLGLHAVLYWTALPGPPIQAWFIFIALQLVLSRVPFVPNLDIVFLTAALHLASVVNVSEAEIAGMLVAEAGLAQLFNFALFGATTHLALRQRAPAAAGAFAVAPAPARHGSADRSP